MKSTSDSHYEFVFKDKTDGKYKHFGWGMVKKEYSPKAYNIIKEKIKDNPDLKNYEIFIKFK